jgi:hypothetical protein
MATFFVKQADAVADNCLSFTPNATFGFDPGCFPSLRSLRKDAKSAHSGIMPE